MGFVNLATDALTDSSNPVACRDQIMLYLGFPRLVSYHRIAVIIKLQEVYTGW